MSLLSRLGLDRSTRIHTFRSPGGYAGTPAPVFSATGRTMAAAVAESIGQRHSNGPIGSDAADVS
eukprot:scaffold9692_cov96-Isochrysis_galbana.AAC.1